MYLKYIVLKLSLFLTLANCNLENPDAICNVIEVNSNSTKPCDFPFMYKDITYHGCTLKDGDGKPWCSTKKDPLSLEHQVPFIDIYINICLLTVLEFFGKQHFHV